MLKFYNYAPRFLGTVSSANEWPCTSTGSIWKLRRHQVIDMPGDFFCLVFTALVKWRVDLRAKIGRYRNTSSEK